LPRTRKASEQAVKFLKTLVIISFTALGAIYIGLAALTQRELTADAITSIALGALLIAGAYGVYRDTKWGYYLALAASATGIAIAAAQGLPIAVAMYAILAASTVILMKKEAPAIRVAKAAPVTPTAKSIFINEKRFIKKKH
jgi:uncharacterized membrane protein (UPF0136 family)